MMHHLRIGVVGLLLGMTGVAVQARESGNDSIVVAELLADSVIVQEQPDDSAAVMADAVAPQQLQRERVRNQGYADTAVFQGVTIRLDILNPLLEQARSSWHTYDIEAAVNVRLKNRFFPTMEFGYAGRFLQEKGADAPVYNGHVEFVRVGMDLNPLKKHPEQRSVMLVGIRAGTGWQKLASSVTDEQLHNKWIADAWGEIVAGVQVNIVKGFNMGWAVRMKFLFTEKTHDNLAIPYYIPGYGYRGSMNWGFDYYLGYTF